MKKSHSKNKRHNTGASNKSSKEGTNAINMEEDAILSEEDGSDSNRSDEEEDEQ